MPRYPFSPAVLDALPEELAELFRELELTLLEEICSRLKIADQLNEATVQDIRALRSHGIDLEDIKKAIAEAAGTGEDKLEKLLDDVVERNQAYYTSLIDLAHVTAPERLVDEADIAAIRRQTWGAYKNITGSMGFLAVKGGRLTFLEPAKAYENALDSALLQVQSGAIPYDKAIALAVKQLADSGLKTVSYESGHVDSVDVAVRRAVMTGVNQLNQKYREQSMDYLETDLVETTAHLGARNTDGPKGWENHAKWQGKVYRWRKDGGYTAPERQTAPTPTPPTPIQTAVPAPVQPVSRAALTPVDVTQEYLDSATPGQGAITYDTDFDQSRHQAEVSFSKWLHKAFGGDIRLLNESKVEGEKRPDYLWNGKLWDLKDVTTEQAANTAIKRGLAQIKSNPGGIILNYGSKEIDLDKLFEVINKRMQWLSDGVCADILIVSNGTINILRYDKR